MKFVSNETNLNCTSPDKVRREHCDIPTNDAEPECNHEETSDEIKGHFRK